MNDFSNKYIPPPPDEAYWQALFADEESNISPASGHNLPDEHHQAHPVHRPSETAVHHHASEWEKAQTLLAGDEPVTLVIMGYNKGGLLVDWEGLPGFIPASQLNNLPAFHLESERIRELKMRQHQQIAVKIIELDPANNRLIFSERAVQTAVNQRDKLLHRLQAGELVSGQITNLAKFGAFVELGGVEGLIHISEISWSRINHPSDVLQPEQEVECIILSIDVAKEHIALSLKQLHPNPWMHVGERYAPGQTVTGTVTTVTNFGVFVEVEKGLEGLIHVSELAEGSFLHPRNVLSKGEVVSARILEVNGAEKKLALSLRK